MKKTLLLLLLPFFAIAQQVPVYGPVSKSKPNVTTANATDSSVEFFWNAVDDAVAYNISYRTDTGSIAREISIGNLLRYPVFGLRSGEKVFFTVTPVNKFGQTLTSGTAEHRALGGQCDSSVVPPAILNGVSVTATGTGSVETYLTQYSSCGIATTPPNSLWLGQTGSFSYTMTFSVPVNNLVIAITATGNTADEIFIFNTNGGVPIIQTTASCFTVVTGNQIASGNNSGSNGGGGIFTIQAPASFTTLTITGPGGTAGSLLSLCANSVEPVECNVSFAPTLSATSLIATCPNTTVNLSAVTATNLPGAIGVSMTWHTAVPVSQANQILTNLASQPAGPTYYAVFYDSVNGCYGTPTAVTTSTTAVTPTFTQVQPICSGQNLPSLPTISLNGISGTWAPSLNNIATTTYTFTPSTPCAITATMTINVTPTVNPVFEPVSPVCSGDAIGNLPLVSTNGITGTWSPPINNTATTTYTFTPNAGQCATTETFEIVVNPKPIVTIEQGCVGQNYLLNAMTDVASPTFQWRDANGFVVGSDASLTVTETGTYQITVSANGCETEVSAVVLSTGCEIQKGISPNGDDFNDFFDLTNLNVANLKIFNRYGMVVYSRGNYTNQWDGKSNDGTELPDATYYYLIELSDGQAKSGWIYINSKKG